jgi:hypothetical protein
MRRSITGENVGPFFESDRLRGTPEDDGYQEPEDDRRRCMGCLRWLPADELDVIDGEMVCTACEDRIEDAEAERRAAKEGRA